MSNFDNSAYEMIASDLINDAFYLDNRSKRGAIATIRTYTEILVRKILDLPQSQKVTLGDRKINKELINISNNDDMLMNAIENIRVIGNKVTHTQIIDEIEEDDFNKIVDNLMDVYAYIFVKYFDKNEFGSNSKIVSAFSILPPIIRYKALNNLYEKYPESLMIIDKLCLSLLKAFNYETTLNWIEDRKEKLESLAVISPKAKDEIIKKQGIEFFEILRQNGPENMYISCREKIHEVNLTIKKRGLLYENFEEAITLYHKKGKVEGNSKEIIEFNSLMEFVYLGRKEEYNEKMKDVDTYITPQFRW
jgi:hypothetical protein